MTRVDRINEKLVESEVPIDIEHFDEHDMVMWFFDVQKVIEYIEGWPVKTTNNTDECIDDAIDFLACFKDKIDHWNYMLAMSRVN